MLAAQWRYSWFVFNRRFRRKQRIQGYMSVMGAIPYYEGSIFLYLSSDSNPSWYLRGIFCRESTPAARGNDLIAIWPVSYVCWSKGYKCLPFSKSGHTRINISIGEVNCSRMTVVRCHIRSNMEKDKMPSCKDMEMVPTVIFMSDDIRAWLQHLLELFPYPLFCIETASSNNRSTSLQNTPIPKLGYANRSTRVLCRKGLITLARYGEAPSGTHPTSNLLICQSSLTP
ncbi:hypothetical protein AG1IA_06963 [Rhizoctonia solani AG-1 IA]|uniref:Uncharacterized protein n=1 Tax=Thanatephorus cucumeris (strain AG1-IA) TaxID=983506 RepID=L8WLG1_THACA|nr:hypothetical protein AG1IA_06963 [Rhizoctonia solani AG-1 IA]